MDNTVKRKAGDVLIYDMIDGKMTRVADPIRPGTQAFIIVSPHGDWSGYRLLEDCEKQFAELESYHERNNRRMFAVIERH